MFWLPYLVLDVNTLQCQYTGQDGVSDKVLILHKLGRCKCGQGGNEQIGCALEVANGHQVGALIDLQTIPAIPVTTFFDHAMLLWFN